MIQAQLNCHLLDPATARAVTLVADEAVVVKSRRFDVFVVNVVAFVVRQIAAGNKRILV